MATDDGRLIGTGGRAGLPLWTLGAPHGVRFSWHAALHELALGNSDAVRARFIAQLSPARVSGIRALVDSCCGSSQVRKTQPNGMRPA